MNSCYLWCFFIFCFALIVRVWEFWNGRRTRFWACFSTAFLNCGLSRVCFFFLNLLIWRWTCFSVQSSRKTWEIMADLSAENYKKKSLDFLFEFFSNIVWFLVSFQFGSGEVAGVLVFKAWGDDLVSFL